MQAFAVDFDGSRRAIPTEHALPAARAGTPVLLEGALSELGYLDADQRPVPRRDRGDDVGERGTCAALGGPRADARRDRAGAGRRADPAPSRPVGGARRADRALVRGSDDLGSTPALLRLPPHVDPRHRALPAGRDPPGDPADGSPVRAPPPDATTPRHRCHPASRQPLDLERGRSRLRRQLRLGVRGFGGAPGTVDHAVAGARRRDDLQRRSPPRVGAATRPTRRASPSATVCSSVVAFSSGRGHIGAPGTTPRCSTRRSLRSRRCSHA